MEHILRPKPTLHDHIQTKAQLRQNKKPNQGKSMFFENKAKPTPIHGTFLTVILWNFTTKKHTVLVSLRSSFLLLYFGK